ncbi:nitrogenase iron-molybdenum cofactor biosynthesis protein NifN [Parasulfuritortus cantonensis]|uniref:Nitrogenase iron-molybdenum cofactor biosynthesis protein NifN n=1 Tax=Parasulfuritortus cantonensis TaxID=2528202 RepID=A0A4R1BD63_9PROT|nr:nitrogenase iron-molybdenum cofactor biosynthesis protein NifN [Parasulfuritortus cantonensis]TCJ14918.1 nitrogenase iron-molybdenum cofactor biosynthesis protein NifN [Parasulfuritortus cantonensis]
MPTIRQSNKALTVNPLRVSQPMGASLAFMGLARAVPLEHGAQGCTAFSKVFFTRHFREPIPLQTTAMDHTVTVMGADDNVVEALATVATRHAPEVVGLVTTGLAETQGVDILRCLAEFRAGRPEFAGLAVVPVNTPDTEGCLESGYALAVEAMIVNLVPETRQAGRLRDQVNVLAASMLSPGDVDAVRDWLAAFGLRARILPDLGTALDGHLDAGGYSDLTTGGIGRGELAGLGESAATLVIGASMARAADLLKARTGVPDYRFDSLMGLARCDAFTQALVDITGRPVPERIERARAQLADAMVDCHFPLGGARVAVAADPDLLLAWTDYLAGLGAATPVAVAAAQAPSLQRVAAEEVVVGDLEDLEAMARSLGVDLLVGNSHAAPSALRLAKPLVRAGFPLHDQYGAHARARVGYAGSRDSLFELANLLAGQRNEIAPYRSIYRTDAPRGPDAAGCFRADPCC